MPNWRFVQMLRPGRALSSCVINYAGEITRTTPQKWRLLILDVRAAVLFRLCGGVRWGGKLWGRRGNAASLDSIADRFAQFLPR